MSDKRRYEDWTRVVHIESGEHGIVANYDADTREYIACWDNGEWTREPADSRTMRKETE